MCVDTLQRYDPNGHQWERLAPLPIPLASGSLLANRDLLYYVGGSPDMIKPSKQLFSYDPDEDAWTELASMNDFRFDPGEKEWLILGNQNDGNRKHDKNDINYLTKKLH
jgi:N-acetylneuraminic acid mutarotase